MKQSLEIIEAKELVKKVLIKRGYSSIESSYIGEAILYGTLRESSQGMNKLFGWHADRDPLASEPTFENTTASIIRCNASRNSGIYANALMVQKLIPIIEKFGLGLAGVYNYNNSSGGLSFYVEQIAKKGYIAIMMASADPIGGIAPTGQGVGVFGTNPIAISIPYMNEVITLDMSTAKYTWGDLVNAELSNAKLELGFARDKNGKLTTDPKEAKKGSVTAFDGSYKGLGLAFMIQVLAGGLVGSIYAQSDEKCDYGNLMIGIDPEKLGGRVFMEAQVREMVNAYKNTENDGPEVFLPGEQGALRYKTNLKNNTVLIESELLDKIHDYLKN